MPIVVADDVAGVEFFNCPWWQEAKRLPLEPLNSGLPRAFLIFSVALVKEIEMRKHVLVLTATTAILACGVIAAIAQAPGAEAQPTPGGPGGMMGMPGMMRDHLGIMGGHPGIMGMMGRDYGHHGSVMARIIFGLMDADGDGKLTLQEWQAAHERIFKAMDTNHDGTVTLEEMEAFMHGTSGPTSPR